MPSIKIIVAAVLAGLLPPVLLAAEYSTTFPRDENPLSESGRWINGRAGLDWANVVVNNGLAHGSEDSLVKYNDSTALLAGTWDSNQMAQATVHVGTRPQPGSYIELELRLRSRLAPHCCTGYECNVSMAANANKPYAQIVRWNGTLGDFTILKSQDIAQIVDGMVIKAVAAGNTITLYTNGVLLVSVADNKFTSGNPGMGFYLEGAGVNDSGFTRFSATDGGDRCPGARTP
jgi:hypothetical protein